MFDLKYNVFNAIKRLSDKSIPPTFDTVSKRIKRKIYEDDLLNYQSMHYLSFETKNINGVLWSVFSLRPLASDYIRECKKRLIFNTVLIVTSVLGGLTGIAALLLK
jgi:hypothetical protein